MLNCVPVRGLVLGTPAPLPGSVFCSQHQYVPGSLCPDPEDKRINECIFANQNPETFLLTTVNTMKRKLNGNGSYL